MLLKGIDVKLNCDFFEDKEYLESLADKVLYTGPIDQYFDFKHGALPYRSIRFETVTLPLASALPTATVNFTHAGPKTRVTEWKKIPCHGDNKYNTTLTFEEPCDYADNNFERYYPVKDRDGNNRKLYEKYNGRKNFICF